jgi:hypothetical protein
MKSICIAAATAVVAQALETEPKFLAHMDEIVEPTKLSTSTCQFIVDGSYYNYFGSDDSLIPTAWTSTTGSTTALFTYCVDLS